MEKIRQNLTFYTTKTIVYMFLVGTAAISFSHIVEVSTTFGLTWEAWTVPFFVDGIALLGKIGRSKRFSEKTQKAGLYLMAFGGVLSLAANFEAGDNPGQQGYGILVVVGFVLTEWYAGKLEAAPEAKAEGKKCAAGCKCGKHKPRKATAKSRTRKPRRTPANAPVSPAWAIEGREPSEAELASIAA